MTGQSPHRPLRLNLGCGRNAIEGWVNIDGSISARLAGFPRLWAVLRMLSPDRARHHEPWPTGILGHDLRKPLPFPDASVQMVYTSHLLEHLYLDEAERLLHECQRVLVPGGVLRVVVPDLRAIVDTYVEACVTAMQGQLIGVGGDGRCAPRERPRGHPADPPRAPADTLNEDLFLRTRSGPRGRLAYRLYAALTDFQAHKWMYDEESLSMRLAAAGFAEVSARGLFDSRIPDIELVEQPERVVNGGLCVEGVKPELAYA